jgi:hypothetical protein
MSEGVILHYESCDFNQWCAKFLNQVDCTPERKQSIPFPYYRDSISLFQQYRDPRQDRGKWVEFYTKRKIGHYNTAEIKAAARSIAKVERPRMIDLMPDAAEALVAQPSSPAAPVVPAAGPAATIRQMIQTTLAAAQQ